MTLGSAAFASQSRLRLACESGLSLRVDAWSSLQRIAGRYGDEGTLQVAQELGMVLGGRALQGAAAAATTAAAEEGRVAVLSWRAEQGCHFGADDVLAAAGGGHVQALQFLCRRGCAWPESACRMTATNGHLEALQWMRENGCPWNAQAICCDAAKSGSIPLIRWLKQEGVTAAEHDVMCAAEYGHIALCAYLHEEVGIAWSESVTAAAAKGGHTETVSWLAAQGCPVNPWKVCVSAAQGGCIELMTEYLQRGQQGNYTEEAQQQLLTDMLNAAGAHCHLESAQWARQRGAEWPAELHLSQTSTDWHGVTLDWAREEGCTAPGLDDDDNDSGPPVEFFLEENGYPGSDGFDNDSSYDSVKFYYGL
eukprot:12975-Heterococcus_DN1.PRE.1